MSDTPSASETEYSSNSPILGIIGCGNIGEKQAANFLSHGYTVYVYDINPDTLVKLQSQGANVAQSCAEVGRHADVIFTALPTPPDVIQAVLEGEQNLTQGLRSGSIYIDISTNSPDIILRLHQAMAQRGVEMLDAPFNDCPIGAKSQNGVGLAVMASGSKQTFEQVQAVLALMADRVLYCGEIGNGTRCKLIHNAVNATAVQAVSEGITLGLAQGISLPTIWDTLRFGSFGQNAGDIHGLPYYWFSRRCDDMSQHPAFTIKLLHKDMRLAVNLATDRNISVPHLTLSLQDYQEAEDRGLSNYSTTKIICLQEERAGVIAKGNLPIQPTPSQPSSQPIVSPKNKFSLSTVLILIVLSNLLQLGFYWLFK
jgi:3-hydroxyisobutyrate dehydrogenase-like beta-hydroxyacid dehydrogenase